MLTAGLLVALLAGSSANPKLPTVEIVKADYEKKISFEATGVEGAAKVSLFDEFGVSLYVQSWKDQPKLGKIFDLEPLPNGNYTLVFETESNEVLQPFKIEKSKILLNSSARVVRVIPTVKKVDQYVSVSWSNDRPSNVNLTIEDSNGAIVMEEKLNNIWKIARRYDVSRLESGTYLVKVKTDAKTYYQEVSW